MTEYQTADGINPFLFYSTVYPDGHHIQYNPLALDLSTEAPGEATKGPLRVRDSPGYCFTLPAENVAGYLGKYKLYRDLSAQGVALLEMKGERIDPETTKLKRYHRKSNPLVWDPNGGMFLLRDKIPVIAWLEKVDGVLLPYSTIILEGANNRVLAKADKRGLIADYFPVDDYNNALVISNNDLVYRLVQDIELEPYIHRFLLKRGTKANATFKMIHRKYN